MESDAGIVIAVRELVPEPPGRTGARAARRPAGVPVVLVHGARVPGLASFDLEVPGGSLAADIATSGHAVYVMDARGYGASTRPPALEAPTEAAPPQVRSDEVVRDIAAVVARVRARTGADRVALLGWGAGGHWAGMYASIHADRVSHLVLLNALYGAAPNHPQLGAGSELELPAVPGRFNAPRFGAYRLNAASSLLISWDESIPVADKSTWRDPLVADAYVRAALASDPTSRTRTPPSFRSPSGAMEDSYYLASGRQLWDASLIRAATLVVRSERDFWSRPEDPTRLQAHLVHAARVEVLTLPGATHHVHLDRADRGRDTLLRTLRDFLRP